jgi:hypothetical protein
MTDSFLDAVGLDRYVGSWTLNGLDSSVTFRSSGIRVIPNDVEQVQRAIRRVLDQLDRPERGREEPLRTPQLIGGNIGTRNCAAGLAGHGSQRCAGRS